MVFDPTPMNMTTMLVVVLAVVALILLVRGRHDSNLPLLFYSATFVLSSLTDRTVSSYLLYPGIASALVLRFEFMSKGFAKFISFIVIVMISLAALAFLDQVFGDGTLFT
jgi:hypothetical protein